MKRKMTRYQEGGDVGKKPRGRAYVSPQERQRQYYLKNPEPGLESVDIESLFMPGARVSGAKQILSKVLSRERKPGAWRNPAAKEKADREMRRQIKEAELRKSGKTVHEDTASYTSPDTIESTTRITKRTVNPDIAGVEKDVASRFDEYRKGGTVRSSASKRADGIAKKGKTRGRIV